MDWFKRKPKFKTLLVIIFVADSVTAVIITSETKPSRIVWILNYWEIYRVETKIIATFGPTRFDAITI